MQVFVGDPGVDDAVALAVLAAQGVDLSLVVATAGNVDVGVAAEVASRVVQALETRWPVQVARRSRLVERPPREGREVKVHGDDGLGGQVHHLPAADDPPDLDAALLRGADLFACGPLTAVAEAIDAGHTPERICWMGGGLEAGNTTERAEFNAWCDPAAVDRVLTSGVPLAIVPLDITRQVQLDDRDLERWTGSAVGLVLARAYEAMVSFGEAVPHDAVAAVAWLRPDLFEWREHRLRCPMATGEERGALRPGDGGPPSLVATTCDAVAIRELIVASVESLGRRL